MYNNANYLDSVLRFLQGGTKPVTLPVLSDPADKPIARNWSPETGGESFRPAPLPTVPLGAFPGAAPELPTVAPAIGNGVGAPGRASARPTALLPATRRAALKSSML